MARILTLGEILVEIMARDIGQSFREPGTLLGPYASGAPAIFIDQVGRMGVPAAILGCVGADDFGRLNTERLQRDGVDISGVAVMADRPTGSAFVTYRDDGSRDFVFNIAHSACAGLGPEQVTPEALAGCTHLHVMGSSLFSPAVVAAAMRAVGIVRAQGGTVSFDPNIRKEMLDSPGRREALQQLLARTDIFLPSGEELTLLVEANSESEAIERLLGLGVREIVIKRGAAGASAIDRQGRFDVAPMAVTEVDPTGAGDCFGGAYVAARQLGLSLQESLRLANAAGALAVTRRGPMEGTSFLHELQAVLAHTDAPAPTEGALA